LVERKWRLSKPDTFNAALDGAQANLASPRDLLFPSMRKAFRICLDDSLADTVADPGTVVEKFELDYAVRSGRVYVVDVGTAAAFDDRYVDVVKVG
jgi:hypothetical protein